MELSLLQVKGHCFRFNSPGKLFQIVSEILLEESCSNYRHTFPPKMFILVLLIPAP